MIRLICVLEERVVYRVKQNLFVAPPRFLSVPKLGHHLWQDFFCDQRRGRGIAVNQKFMKVVTARLEILLGQTILMLDFYAALRNVITTSSRMRA